MAKKVPILTGWQVTWGDDNSVAGSLEELTRVSLICMDNDEIVSIDPDGDGGVTLEVGAILIAIRRPTPTEKRQGWERIVEVVSGLDDEYVILGEEAGAVIPSDESDEAE